MSPRKTVVGLGEILWDLYPDEKHLGGAPANSVIHAEKLGAGGIVVSSVGQDRLGDEIIETLRNYGVDPSYIQRCAVRPTGTVGVRLDEKHIPHFDCSRDVAFDYIEWNDKLEKLAGKADCVITGTLAQRNKISRKTIQRFLKSAASAVKVFDVNFRGWSELTSLVVQTTLIIADILKLNEKELNRMQRAFWQEERGIISFLDWLIEKYSLKLAALTLGEKGCFLTDGKNYVLSPAFVVDPVDTTGCGDGFLTGMVVRYLEKASLEEMAEFANLLGAFVATKNGAAPEYTLESLEEFREKHQKRAEVKL